MEARASLAHRRVRFAEGLDQDYRPHSARMIDNVVDAIEPLRFDRMYSHFHHREIKSDAKGAVRRSAERYKQAFGLQN